MKNKNVSKKDFLIQKTMDTKRIFDFLNDIKENNNREWFADNKERYKSAFADFQEIANLLIARISSFDKDIANVQAKDCLFRIYRDIRFSPNKVPYKTHFGVYIASAGGRKSPRAGYYLHLEPNESLICGGIYMPEPNVLKALRQAIYDNIDEFKELVEDPKFTSKLSFWEDEQLKSVPRGFPKDWADANYLKVKHYTYGAYFDDSFFRSKNWLDETVDLFHRIYPLNRFFNYTVDEVLKIMNYKL